MKKRILTVGIICGLAMINFTGCSSTTIEDDAIKAGEVACKSLEMLGETIKNPNDKDVLAKAESLQKEAEALEKKMKEKYSSDADQKKFSELVLAYLDDKCDASFDFGFDDLDFDDMDFSNEDWDDINFDDMDFDSLSDDLEEFEEDLEENFEEVL